MYAVCRPSDTLDQCFIFNKSFTESLLFFYRITRSDEAVIFSVPTYSTKPERFQFVDYLNNKKFSRLLKKYLA